MTGLFVLHCLQHYGIILFCPIIPKTVLNVLYRSHVILKFLLSPVKLDKNNLILSNFTGLLVVHCFISILVASCFGFALQYQREFKLGMQTLCDTEVPVQPSQITSIKDMIMSNLTGFVVIVASWLVLVIFFYLCCAF